MTKLEHVHLNELEFDVRFVVLEGADDLCLVVIGGVSLKLSLDLSDLILRLVGAAGNLLVQSLEDGDQSANAVHDVIVISGEDRAKSGFETGIEVIVVGDAV